MKEETKKKAAKIWDGVKDGLEKGYNVSKKGLKKAGKAIQDFGDKSVLLVETKQFELKRKKAVANLGELVFKKLSVKNANPVDLSDEEVAALLKEISAFEKEISKREKLIKKTEKNSDASLKSQQKEKKAKPHSTVAKKVSEAGEK